MQAEKLLTVYLQDHAAGSRAGLGLCRRAESGRSEADAWLLEGICAEIAADRDSLLEIMRRFGVRPSPVKELSAWLIERIGRFKLNGQLFKRSPLSELNEVEGLVIGVTGKLELWRSLAAVAGSDPRLAEPELEELRHRAESQRERLEELHRRAALAALGPHSSDDAPVVRWRGAI